MRQTPLERRYRLRQALRPVPQSLAGRAHHALPRCGARRRCALLRAPPLPSSHPMGRRLPPLRPFPRHRHHNRRRHRAASPPPSSPPPSRPPSPPPTHGKVQKYTYAGQLLWAHLVHHGAADEAGISHGLPELPGAQLGAAARPVGRRRACVGRQVAPRRAGGEALPHAARRSHAREALLAAARRGDPAGAAWCEGARGERGGGSGGAPHANDAPSRRGC